MKSSWNRLGEESTFSATDMLSFWMASSSGSSCSSSLSLCSRDSSGLIRVAESRSKERPIRNQSSTWEQFYCPKWTISLIRLPRNRSLNSSMQAESTCSSLRARQAATKAICLGLLPSRRLCRQQRRNSWTAHSIILQVSRGCGGSILIGFRLSSVISWLQQKLISACSRAGSSSTALTNSAEQRLKRSLLRVSSCLSSSANLGNIQTMNYVLGEDKLLEIFRVYDEDADGYILTSQLGKLIRSARLFPSDDNIEELKKKVDHGGRFNQGDFVKVTMEFYQKQKHVNHEQEMMKAFAFFDQEECGTISLEQLRRIMDSFNEPLSYQQSQEIMRLAKKSGDGKLHYRDFVRMILGGKLQ